MFIEELYVPASISDPFYFDTDLNPWIRWMEKWIQIRPKDTNIFAHFFSPDYTKIIVMLFYESKIL